MIRNHLLIAAVLAAAVLASHGNSLKSGFVHDDRVVILENPYLDKLSNLKWIFSQKYFAVSGEATFRPAVTISYYTDRAVWGQNPFGYHLTNLLIHFTASYAVFHLAWLIWGSGAASLLAASAFAVHPVLSEAVNSVGYREDLMCAALYLGSLIFALKGHLITADRRASGYDNRRRLKASACCLLSAALYFAALLSKEMALTYPIVLALSLRRVDGERGLKRSLFRPFELAALTISATALYLYLRFGLFSFNPTAPKVEYPGGSLLVSILTAPKVVVQYLGLSFFPVNLSADYIVRPVGSPGDSAFIIPGLILAGAVAVAFFTRRKAPNLFFGAAWFFLALLPVYNLLPLYNPKAERYLYLPLFGLVAPLAATIWKMLNRAASTRSGLPIGKAAPALIAAVLFTFTLLSFNRTFVWRDDRSLWLETASDSPGSAKARVGLGLVYKWRDALDKAIAEYNAALSIKPGYPLALNNLGSALDEVGLTEPAIASLTKAAIFGAPFAMANKNLGAVYGRMGSYDRSVHQLKTAIHDKRDYFEAINFLGVVFKKMGLLERAKSEFERTLKEGIYNPEVFQALGNTYHAMGLYNKAVLEYARGLALYPKEAALHRNLGLIYLQALGDIARAKRHIAASLLIDPSQKEAQSLRMLTGSMN